MIEFLKRLLEIAASQVDKAEANCPQCGTVASMAVDRGFDVTKRTYMCGSIYKFKSNFPGIIFVEKIKDCEPEKIGSQE